MSAIIGFNVNKDLDGLRRYNTRVKVLIHSHTHKDPIEVSDDVLTATVGKNIKGVGRANIGLVARKNYLNTLFPNDYINIYFDIGDGSGWTRTFFGLIDRIEESYSVDEKGTPTTLYTVIASDFQKIFAKTNIYFNPHLFDRQDVQGEEYNAFNIGGVALMTKGIEVKGSPASMVTNQILLQIGFGSQWILPQAYPNYTEDRFAQQRSQYASGVLFDNIRHLLQPEQASRLKAVIEGEGLSAFQEDAQGNLVTALQSGAGVNLDSESKEVRVNTALAAAGLSRDELSPGELNSLRNANDVNGVARALSSARMRQELFGDGLTQKNRSLAQNALNRYAAAERTVERRTVVDILNLFDFVERRSMDGYSFDLAIWERQGPLLNILRSVSNEVVNELVFDLRPMTMRPGTDKGGGTFTESTEIYMTAGTNWDRSKDDVGGNVADDTNRTDGVRYMPSVVMREYPFSTVYSVDGRDVPLRLRRSKNTTGNLGILYFGGVFSNLPNAAGRHLVSTPVLNIEERVKGLQGPDRAYKHLDVAVISETEIRSSKFGRSDNDHYNLFEMYTDNVLGQDHRFFMYDFLPIITPVHIMRHGLRVRTASTRFSRYPPTVVNRTQPQEEAPEEETTEAEVSLEEGLIPPVGAHPSLHFRNRNAMAYGYRPRTSSSSWTFHNGIDIYGDGPDRSQYSFQTQREGNSQGQVDVVAIADGLIVGSMAQGTMRLYGNAIAIYHPQYDVISWYAHLAHREPFTGNVDASRNRSDAFNREYTGIGSSRFEPIPVRRGQKIGSVGVTAGRRGEDRNAIFSSDRAHLHFEIVTTGKVPSQNRNATPPIPFTDLPSSSPKPPGSNPNSQDPVAWFRSKGIDLVAEINALGDNPLASDFDEETSIDETTEVASANSRVAADTADDLLTQQAQGFGFRGYVDTVDSRQQLGRWSLLQDHWFQHNLEYVSGQIVMRPAPEVRVGYRLDVVERRMSFYVESVQHSWNFPNEMQTTIQVTRGQPNNPYPRYALPPLRGFNMPASARKVQSRLGRYFIIPDPIAVRRAIALRKNTAANTQRTEFDSGTDTNVIDEFPDNYGFAERANGAAGLIPASSIDFGPLSDAISIDLSRGLSVAELNQLLEAYLDSSERLSVEDADALDAVSGTTGLDGTTLGGDSD